VHILAYPHNFKLFNQFSCKFLSRLLALVLILVFNSPNLFATTAPHIAVLYPESGKRASQLYKTIIKNMQQRENVVIISRQFSVDTDAEKLQQWLRAENIQAVILLGKKGLQFSLKLNVNIPVITGAHMGVLPGRSAVTLSADPQQLFYQLKKLQPQIKTVHVIYNQANSGWIIKKAERAAKKNNLQLNAIQADSVQASAQALKALVNTLNARHDSIWLPYDPVFPVKPLLPDLLKKSWQDNLIIFSGNPYHVQQGILFALFPDYSKLGNQLIDLALHKVQKDDSIHIEASQYLNSAINIRTATHLGILLSSVEKNNYKMVFPKN